MKTISKIFLIATFLASSSIGFAQSVNGILLKDITAEYVQIVGTSKMLSNKLTIELDFGQLNKVWVIKDTQLVDANGKQLVLNSMIDALNFMSSNGYDFVQAYAFSVGQQNVFHYLLKKKKE